MEVGKLATTMADGEVGKIFYFILDELQPDEPRPTYMQYFYVLTAASSYVDAFYFLCHSLCDVSQERRLRAWHTLFERSFGQAPYATFAAHVRAAPRWSRTTGSLMPQGGQHSTTAHSTRLGDAVCLPALYQDETSARAALECYVRQSQRDGNIPRCGRRDGVPKDATEVPRVATQAGLITTTTTHTARTSAGQPHGISSTPTKGHRDTAPHTPPLPKAHTPITASSLQLLWKAMFDELRKSSEGKVAELRAEVQHLKAQLARTGNGDKDEVVAATRSGTHARGEAAPPSAMRQSEHHEACVRERDELRAELTRARRAFAEARQQQGEQLQRILRDNQATVSRIEQQLCQKEAELRRVYDAALQSRDVRLAQLTEELWQAQQENHRTATALAQYKQKRTEKAERKDGAEADELARLRAENVQLRSRLQAAEQEGDVAAWHARYEALQQAHATAMSATKAMERRAESAERGVRLLRAELQRAALTINLLKDGLQTVKEELPDLRHGHLHTVGNAQNDKDVAVAGLV